MSGASASTWTENSLSRLACSDRTPTMKNAPRPTASRITRVWLPGRDRCSTAWRSGNDRELAQRREQRDEAAAGKMQHDRQPAEAGADHQPTRSDAACHAVSATSAADDQRRSPRVRVQSRAPADASSSRSSSDGLTNRTCSSGTTENSSETSTPMPMPCAAALQRDAVVRLCQQRRRGAERERNRRDRRPRERDAEQAAGQAERHHLQHVDRDDLPAARADALQHGDAADLLQDEHAGHARHGDAAEDHDDQADQAQVVLRAIEVAADLIVGRAIRPRVDEVVLEVLRAACGRAIVDALVGHPAACSRRSARLPKPSSPVDARSA